MCGLRGYIVQNKVICSSQFMKGTWHRDKNSWLSVNISFERFLLEIIMNLVSLIKDYSYFDQNLGNLLISAKSLGSVENPKIHQEKL